MKMMTHPPPLPRAPACGVRREWDNEDGHNRCNYETWTPNTDRWRTPNNGDSGTASPTAAVGTCSHRVGGAGDGDRGGRDGTSTPTTLQDNPAPLSTAASNCSQDGWGMRGWRRQQQHDEDDDEDEDDDGDEADKNEDDEDGDGDDDEADDGARDNDDGGDAMGQQADGGAMIGFCFQVD